MTYNEIDVVLFDVFGTVVDWRSSVIRAWQRFATDRGIGLDAENFADEWRAKYRPSIAAVRSGERAFTSLDQLHLENLLEVLADHCIDSSRIPPSALIDLSQVWHRLDPWPDSVSGLNQLRKICMVGPLSNGNTSLLTRLARHGALPWDVVIGSDMVQAFKPDPRAYRRAAQLLDTAPGSIMLCAAHNDDLRAARAAGFGTAFLLRPYEHGPLQTTDLEPTDDWDMVVRSIPELSRALSRYHARAS
jgi:2-haloacid dehalogenase